LKIKKKKKKKKAETLINSLNAGYFNNHNSTLSCSLRPERYKVNGHSIHTTEICHWSLIPNFYFAFLHIKVVDLQYSDVNGMQ